MLAGIDALVRAAVRRIEIDREPMLGRLSEYPLNERPLAISCSPRLLALNG